MGEISGFILSDEMLEILHELELIRSSLRPGEWLNEADQHRVDELEKRLIEMRKLYPDAQQVKDSA